MALFKIHTYTYWQVYFYMSIKLFYIIYIIYVIVDIILDV